MRTGTILFMRHSLTGKADHDELRQLTPDGHELARTAGKLMAEIKFFPDVIVHSPALRVIQTRDDILEVLDPTSKFPPQMTEVPDLYKWDEMNGALEAVGSLVMEDYIGNEYEPMLLAFEKRVREAVERVLADIPEDKHVLVLSHAMCSNAAATAVSKDWDVIRSIELPEACFIKVKGNELRTYNTASPFVATNT